MGMNDPKGTKYEGTTHEPKEEDVNAWRLFLRTKEYLTPKVRCNTATFVSLSGTELSDTLLNMTETGLHRRRANMNKIFKGDSEDLPRPIFVTEEESREFDDIANKTIVQIKDIVTATLASVNNDITRQGLEEDWSKVRNKTKPHLVSFYNELCELICMQGPFVPDSHSNNADAE